MTDSLIADELRLVFVKTLAVNQTRAIAFGRDTPLFGTLPELDSLSVADLLTAIEDRFGIIVDDDEIDQHLFATFGALADYIAAKVQNTGNRTLTLAARVQDVGSLPL